MLGQLDTTHPCANWNVVIDFSMLTADRMEALGYIDIRDTARHFLPFPRRFHGIPDHFLTGWSNQGEHCSKWLRDYILATLLASPLEEPGGSHRKKHASLKGTSYAFLLQNSSFCSGGPHIRSSNHSWTSLHTTMMRHFRKLKVCAHGLGIFAWDHGALLLPFQEPYDSLNWNARSSPDRTRHVFDSVPWASQ